MRQIEQMESEELMTQKKLRTEVIQLEDMLAQVRKEYEMLRIEFEQNLAANEQTGPINKEMRNLIQSLQTQNNQLKGEVGRYKRKCKEANLEIVKLRKDLDEMKTAEIKALQIQKELKLKLQGKIFWIFNFFLLTNSLFWNSIFSSFLRFEFQFLTNFAFLKINFQQNLLFRNSKS